MLRKVFAGVMDVLFVIGLCVAVAGAHADTVKTGVTGSNQPQPFNNIQPSLAMNLLMPMSGVFPSHDGSGTAIGGMLGFVYTFAGNFAPGTSVAAQGQLIPISQNTAVFSLLGTTYGGNGASNFALPDLLGTAIVGAGQGPGLSLQLPGASIGSATASLTIAQLPSHNHALPLGAVTGSSGGNQPIDNFQPSLPLNRLIATQAVLPGTGSAAFLGQVATFAGNFVPDGWAVANGQLLTIASNNALFTILGTTYGGNGLTTFALPDLRGRVSVGANATHPLGTAYGQESTVLTPSQMPAHTHAVLSGGVTGSTGGSTPVNHDQPSLALNYLIALQGIFPVQGGGGFDPNTPYLGQITEFAGNFAPTGWAFASGQLMPIIQNQALFALLGTTYGGNGTTTFALPDLRGRTLIGSGGGFPVGNILGTDLNTLTMANLAAHDHILAATDGAPLFWRNKANGQNIVWLMNGLSISNSASLPTIADTNWEIKGVGDFDGDGKADVLWRNKVTGQNIVWLMSGLTMLNSASLPTIADTTWEIKGVGDFDNDGKADVIWRNKATGQNVGWLMNGLAMSSSALLPTIADLNWEIKGVGDFDDDGKADVIWRNKATGQNIGWLMNGLALSTNAFLPTIADTSWEIKGIGDFDGGGKADVIWRNKVTGQNVGWLMNGLALSNNAFLPTIAESNWEIKRIGDFDDDGKADVILRNKVTGENIGWLMNGLTITNSAFLPTIADTNWEIVGQQ